MGLRTAAEYLEGLRDNRTIYFRGERVPDLMEHPELRVGAEHTALDYRLAEDKVTQELFTEVFPETGERVSRYFIPPAGTEDLLKRREMIEMSTRAGSGVVLLIKEIGTDALFSLYLVARQVDQKYGTDYLGRVKKYHVECRDRDLSMAVAQTDAKGDRGLLPSKQIHPDYYVHIVEKRADGIVVRGAKAHTTGTAFVDEIIVLPTRALSEEDQDYAVAFAIPVNTPGVRLIASPFGFSGESNYHHPVSSKHHLVETLTVFDDVFVPNERIFLAGEWDFAGLLANTFVEFHRFTAVSYKPPLLDLLIGATSLIAVYNGVEKASHIRDKVTRLITYTETIRALTRAAAMDCKVVDGIAVPDTLTTNIAKFHFANNYHEAVRDVQDIAGALLVTGPSEEDWHNDDTRGDLEHYLGGRRGVSAMDRMKAINLIRDLTASDFGGYHELLAIHAEGSLEAQKITIFRGYDILRCMDIAKTAAGIE